MSRNAKPNKELPGGTMWIIRRAFLAALIAAPSLLQSQAADSLQLGDRVRVRVAATRGNTNLFVGNVASISPDTLVIDIPGGKGTITVARAAISEVAISNGRESRFTNLPRALPALAGTFLIATAPSIHNGPHANALRNQRYVLMGLSAIPLILHFRRTPAEHWEPVYSWLDARPAR
jgi:preprotein translocase subunit YajC